jgi:hypothetical protein
MRRTALFLFFVLVLPAAPPQQQQPPRRINEPDEPVRLPNGKLQQEEMLKLDHDKDVADARDLARLATELKDEIEKGSPHVLSVGAIRKTEDIEKLAKRIRGRIRRY